MTLAPPRAEIRPLFIYTGLEKMYGGRTWHWMPDYVRGPMDVMAGAVLVQHTTWVNAERALGVLRAAGALDARALAAMPEGEIAALVRVSGTPAVKAKRLRALAQTIEAGGGPDAMLALPVERLRALLLATHGIGPETADAIALYASGRRVFVVDAYTRRLFRRIGAGPREDSYGAWQRWFEDALPSADAALFQRYHAWIVLHSKEVCRAKPRCRLCPLRACCDTGARESDGGR